MPRAEHDFTTPTPGRRGLLGGAAALVAAYAATLPPSAYAAGSDPDPDAALIALAAEILAVHAEADRIHVEMDVRGLPWSESGRIMREQIHPLVDRIHDMEERLATMRATTLDGFRAKARIVQTFSNCSPGFADPWQDDAMWWSLANDLLGVPSVWRPDDDGEAVA